MKLKIAIIGYGQTGRNIHGAYAKAGDAARIAAIVESDAGRRALAQQDFPQADLLENHRDLLDMALDLVVVAAPEGHLHVPVCMDLLAHGLNVLCEMPLVRYAYELENLLHEARKQKVCFVPFYPSIFGKPLNRLKTHLKEGVLGRIGLISLCGTTVFVDDDPPAFQKYYGGSLGLHAELIYQAVCLLDCCAPDAAREEFVRHNAAQNVTALQGTAAIPDATVGISFKPTVLSALDCLKNQGDSEDFVKILLKTPGLPLVDLEASPYGLHAPDDVSVQGTCDGFVDVVDSAMSAVWFDKFAAPGEALQGWSSQDAIFQFYARLFDVLQGGTAPLIDEEKWLLQARLMEEVYEQNSLPLKKY